MVSASATGWTMRVMGTMATMLATSVQAYQPVTLRSPASFRATGSLTQAYGVRTKLAPGPMTARAAVLLSADAPKTKDKVGEAGREIEECLTDAENENELAACVADPAPVETSPEALKAETKDVVAKKQSAMADAWKQMPNTNVIKSVTEKGQAASGTAPLSLKEQLKAAALKLLDDAAEKNAERKRIEAEEKAALEADKPKSVSPLEAVSKLDEKSLALASGNLALLLGIPFVTIAAIYFLYITSV